MRMIVMDDYDDMCRKAAQLIEAQITLKPDSVLGLATGSTPLGIYKLLVEWYQNGELDFSKVMTVNLDEYYGLSPESEQSYHYYMNKNLFSKININPDNTYLPDGTCLNAEYECRRYQELTDSLGGIDLQLLGLGHNGHIGFNEPSDGFSKDVHLVDLSDSTIEANRRFFASEEEVPRQAYTMGIGTIFQAKKIVLVVNGEGKKDILRRVLHGPICPQIPATILKLHTDVTVVADKAAAGHK